MVEGIYGIKFMYRFSFYVHKIAIWRGGPSSESLAFFIESHEPMKSLQERSAIPRRIENRRVVQLGEIKHLESILFPATGQQQLLSITTTGINIRPSFDFDFFVVIALVVGEVCVYRTRVDDLVATGKAHRNGHRHLLPLPCRYC